MTLEKSGDKIAAMEIEFTRAPRRDETDAEPDVDPDAEVDRNHARLAAAAQTLLRTYPEMVANFGYDAAILMGEPGGDALIAGMIEYAMALREFGYETMYEQIEEESGIAIGVAQVENPDRIEDEIKDMQPREGICGRLVALSGTNVLPGHTRYIEGTAVVAGTKGRERFATVGLLENGTVFGFPEDLH